MPSPPPLRLAPLAAALLVGAGESLAQTSPAATVAGVVVDSASRLPLRANVALDPGGRTARADAGGRFAFAALPAGEYTVRVTAFGYRASSMPVRLAVATSVGVTVALVPLPRALDTVRTSADVSPARELGRAPAGGSVTTFTKRDVTVIPAVGEMDVLRVASLLPGIAARNDFWAGFNVRGGESDQTQVRLDGLPVFSPFHLGGLFSTFIPEAVGEVEARVGALPASSGGRLSGALDVESAEDGRRGVHGAVDLSAISASAKLGGALPRVAGSWSVAARRAYADALADLVMYRGAFPYHFQDAQLHAAVVTRGGGTLRLTGYAGLDLLDPTSSDTTSVFGEAGSGNTFRFDWGNRLAGLSFTQPLGARSELVQRVAYTTFSTRFDDSSGIHLGNTIGELRVSGELARRWPRADSTEGHALRAGYELSRLRTRYDELITAAGADEIGTALVIDDTVVTQRASAGAAWLDAVWAPGARLGVRAGVRAERVGSAGWSGVSPRLAVKYRPRDGLALTAAAGRYAQWVHAVRNEDLPLRIVDIWFTSDRNVPVSTGTEVVGGAELWLSRSDMLRVEAYGKRFADLIEPASTIDPRLRPADLRRFGGTSRGLDVLLRHHATERLSGWVSYSLARSVRENEAGERYSPAHDRRHDLNVVGSWRMGERYVVAARLGASSGTPYTGWSGSYARWSYDPVARRWRPPPGTSSARNEQVRSPRNAERYPAYRRLDVGAHRYFQWRRAEVDAFLNLVNVLNRQNVLLYTFDASPNPPEVRGFSQLPFLPSAGVRVVF